MARWEPHAADRLVVAALDLFAERGYESTTVVEIAERAGLTKSTFFRHFPDKREVLFGGDTLAALLGEAVAAAPAAAGPLDAVAHAMDAVGREVFSAERRALVARRRAVVAAHAELSEREALKGRRLVATTAGALERRGVPGVAARVAAELGALAMTLGYERWSASAGGEDAGGFGAIARHALDEVRAAAAGL